MQRLKQDLSKEKWHDIYQNLDIVNNFQNRIKTTTNLKRPNENEAEAVNWVNKSLGHLNFRNGPTRKALMHHFVKELVNSFFLENDWISEFEYAKIQCEPK